MDTTQYKTKLEEERDHLVKELGSVGMINPDNQFDWIPTGGRDTEQEADPTDMADHMEDLGERVALEKTLETRLREVLGGLKKIKEGSYGMCTEGGAPHAIPEGRLDANPAAATCIEHAN